jgi:hypothetical protein
MIGTYRCWVAAGAAVAIVLSGCTGAISANEDIGQVRYVDGGAQIIVPALWAGTDANGDPVGGIEPAEIFISTSARTPEYSVDLADIAAEGAGSAWQAATAMASAFATAFASANPAAVDLGFTVTGAIDGPSAGGILTVGLIAAFQGQSLRPGVTMTGTISADGSIGPVGGVLTKIEAAAREGFDTVVLPAALAPQDWDSGNAFTELADSLNVTLIPVNTIGEAYAAMTGGMIEAPDLSPGPPLSARTEAVTTSDTEGMVQRLARTLDSAAQVLPEDLAAWAQTQVTNARQDLAAGNTARAYGKSTFALTQITRAVAASDLDSMLTSQGPQAAREYLEARARDVRNRAERTLQAASTTEVRGLAQCFALPTAMGWSSFAQVTMTGVLEELAQNPDEDTLREMAASIAEGELGIDVFLPPALAVVTSIDEGGGEDCSEIAPHLSGYSRFLIRAADATSNYLTNVLGTTLQDLELKEDYTQGALAADQLAQGVTPAIDPYPQEAQQFTLALTYFWLTSYAVSALQAYAVVPDESPGVYSARRAEAMHISIDQTWWFIKYRAEILAAQGFDTGAPIWSARWALEESLSQRNSAYATDADWLALGELWYDGLQVTAMLSYLNPATIQEQRD